MTAPPNATPLAAGRGSRAAWRLWLPPALWAVMIYCLSSLSFGQLPPAPGFMQQYQVDKVVHLALFGGLAWLVLRAIHRGTGLGLPAALLIALVATSAYGASDEWHQSFVPGRYPSWDDWVADTLGGVLAVVVYHRFPRLRPGPAAAAAAPPIANRQSQIENS